MQVVFTQRGNPDTDTQDGEEDVKRHREKTAGYKPKRSLEQLLHSLRRNHSDDTWSWTDSLQSVTQMVLCGHVLRQP